MKLSSFVRGTLFGAALAMLAACGGAGKPGAAEGTITSTQAGEFKTERGDQVTSLAQPKPDAGSFGSAPSARRALARISPEYRNVARFIDREDCDPTNSDTTDADRDGIPKNNTMSFSCNITESGFTLTASGSITITDGNDDDKKSGFTFTIAGVKFVLTSTASETRDPRSITIEMQIDGTFAVTVAGTKITASGDVQFAITSSGKSVTVGFWGDTSATGTDEADPFAAGEITVDNWFKIESDAMKFTLHITSENLTYGACARLREDDDDDEDGGRLNGGKLKIADGANNTLSVEFSSACVATWKYNDETL